MFAIIIATVAGFVSGLTAGVICMCIVAVNR